MSDPVIQAIVEKRTILWSDEDKADALEMSIARRDVMSFVMAIEDIGLVIVPAGAVPTPEERAAVGRLVAFAEQRFAAVTSDDHWRDLAKSWNATNPADIEAARAVAEGGGDGA